MKPKYTHDCSNCTFIGNAAIKNQPPMDFYFCAISPSFSDTSLIWRYGDAGPEYGSTRLDFVSPLSINALIAFGLYLEHHGINGANNATITGDFFSNNIKILSL